MADEPSGGEAAGRPDAGARSATPIIRGQVWQDRDARMDGRRCVVIEPDDNGKVLLHSYGRYGPQSWLVTRVRADNLRKRWKLVPNDAL